MIPLPAEYLEQMETLLGAEYSAFRKTYDHDPTRGLRINTLKIAVEEGLQRLPFSLSPIPWCNEGFFYNHEKDRPGKHVYHAAGLYYIQDPSAMAPVVALDPQPGERILDLCAAPGGKTTQIAAKMKGFGTLVANEIHPQRIKALAENLERCGIHNVVLLNETPHRLTKRFTSFFDRILVDAPCSGEGMFRKDPDVCTRWSVRATYKCAEVQLQILEAAAPMLRAGGTLTYSTCTFNPVENEGVLHQFLEKFPEFRLRSVPHADKFLPGRPEWVNAQEDLRHSARLWPHHVRGEGHFIAVLEKMDGSVHRPSRSNTFPAVPRKTLHQFHSFARENLTASVSDQTYTLFGNHLYQIPADDLPPLDGLKVERPGLYLGQIKRNHFLPAHTLAMALTTPDQFQRSVSFTPGDPQLYSYLRGEALPYSGEKGWTLVTVDTFPLGFGKASGGLLKNHYPKWLRWDR